MTVLATLYSVWNGSCGRSKNLMSTQTHASRGEGGAHLDAEAVQISRPAVDLLFCVALEQSGSLSVTVMPPFYPLLVSEQVICTHIGVPAFDFFRQCAVITPDGNHAPCVLKLLGEKVEEAGEQLANVVCIAGGPNLRQELHVVEEVNVVPAGGAKRDKRLLLVSLCRLLPLPKSPLTRRTHRFRFLPLLDFVKAVCVVDFCA